MAQAIRCLDFLLRGLSWVFWRLPYVVDVHHHNSLKAAFEPIALYYKNLKSAVDRLPSQPKISVLIPVYKVRPEYFLDALLSVARQTYENWEVCVVDDASNDAEIIKIIEKFAQNHPGKVKWSVNSSNMHISHTSNNCLKLATGEFVALLDHDDRLYPNALGEVVRHINYHDNPDILYSDERVVDENGALLNHPFFKPDFSPFFHMSVNYTTHLSVYNRELVKKSGGFRPGFEGSQDHDLMLRMTELTEKPIVHINFCLYQWRAHRESTAGNPEAKPYAALAGEKAVSEAMVRRGQPGVAEWEPDTLHYRLRFDLPETLPLVSIVIPSKDGLKLIKECLRSVFCDSTYRNFEVVVMDNGTTDPECLKLFDHYSESYGGERFRVVKQPGSFNFAALNNSGAKHARGDYLILLNNDTSVISPGWIEEMLSFAQFEHIGAVGCKLLFEDNSIQHAGVLLTDRAIATHACTGRKKDTDIYMQISNTVHEVSAVTAACLMIKKEKYELVGGLDECWVPNGWGDVDFCLRLTEKGLTNLYTPYAQLYHFESPTRRQSLEYFEHHHLLARHGQKLLNDPFLNPSIMRDAHYSPNLNYVGFDLPEKSFQFFLRNAPEDWTKPRFMDFLKQRKVKPTAIKDLESC